MCAVRAHGEIGAQLYINDGKELFGYLYACRDEIESEVGLEFEWRDPPDKKSSTVRIAAPAGSGSDAARQDGYRWLADTLAKMKDTFENYVSRNG